MPGQMSRMCPRLSLHRLLPLLLPLRDGLRVIARSFVCSRAPLLPSSSLARSLVLPPFFLFFSFHLLLCLIRSPFLFFLYTLLVHVSFIVFFFSLLFFF